MTCDCTTCHWRLHSGKHICALGLDDHTPCSAWSPIEPSPRTSLRYVIPHKTLATIFALTTVYILAVWYIASTLRTGSP